MKENSFFENFRITENDLSALEGSVKLFHDKKSDGNYANLGESIVISIRIPRSLLVFHARVILINAHEAEETYEITGIRSEYDLYSDIVIFKINVLTCPGLFFYFFKLDAGTELYGYRKKNDILAFSYENPREENLFQITVTEEKSKRKSEIHGIIYHIFVDRFFRAGNLQPRSDSIMIDDWYGEIPEYPKFPGAYLKNNTFFGGNLYGIIEKLGYLKSLGVSLIYLSPIFESSSNHKYDTGDYEKIDGMFGGNYALKLLIDKAAKLNIGIILDGVFNHTGADSKYFNKYGKYNSLGAYQSKKSRYYNWYRFEAYPDKYDSWWGIDILPKIYYEKGDAENYFLGEGGVVEKWMRLGIRGFRLDVADELSDSFIKRMRSLISTYNPDALLYGEVWEDASNKTAYGKRKRYYLGTELTGVMNYPLKNGIISYIRKKDVAEIEYALNSAIYNMPIYIRNTGMNILGSHDTVRIITALGGGEAYGKSNDELSRVKLTCEEYLLAKKRVIAAYTLAATLPGIPTVYYGDEAGIEGYSDPFNRKTYPWGKEDKDILSHYKKIGKLRTDYAAFFDGDFHILHLDKNFLIYERKKEDERFVTVYNNSQNDFKISLTNPILEILQNLVKKEFTLKSEEAYVFKTNIETEFEIGC